MTSFTPWLLFILIRVFYELVKNLDVITGKPNANIKNDVHDLKSFKRRYNMIKFLFRRKIANTPALFNGHYMDAKVLFMLEMKEVPSVCFIGEMDVAKALAWISDGYKYDVKHVYQHTYYDHDKQQSFFNNTIFVLKYNRMIELGIDYCYILNTWDDYAWANRMMTELAVFRLDTGATGQTKIIGFARQPQMN